MTDIDKTGSYTKAVQTILAEIETNKEEIVRAFVAKYGYDPEKAVMVQESTINGFKFYIRQRTEEELLLEKATFLHLDTIGPNSLITIKGIDYGAEAAHSALTAITNMLPKGTLVWVLQGDEDIQTVSEEMMNQMGWFRKPGEKS